MAKIEDIYTSSLGFAQQTVAPSTPTSGNNKIYFKTDGKLYYVNSSGSEVVLATSGDITANGILTAIKTVDGTGSGLDADLLDGNEASVFALKTELYSAVDTQADSYTLALANSGKLQKCTKGTDMTVTIPTNAVVEFPINTEIAIIQYGAGKVTVAGVGVTINSAGGLKSSSAQYASITLKKIATDEWLLVGSLIA